MKFDIVVIGAGPGGLHCATKLSESGANVAVIEKRAVPFDKICGGGLTHKCLKKLSLPANAPDRKFYKARIHYPFTSATVRKGDILAATIKRKKLCSWMAENCQKSGARIIDTTYVKEIRKDSVVTSTGEKFGFDYLVGADGCHSIVRKRLGLKEGKELFAIQHRINGNELTQMEYFNSSRYFGTGYAWIFPYDGFALVGCGCDTATMSPKQLSQNFSAWMKKKNINPVQSRLRGAPISCRYSGHQFGRTFLVGDAAGVASSFSGEGIYQAIVSGEQVAGEISGSKKLSKEMSKVIADSKRDWALLHLLRRLGPLRDLGYETMGIMGRLGIIPMIS